MSGGGSSFGINWVKFAAVDDTGKIITDPSKGGLGTDGVYLADAGAEGTSEAKIDGLEEKGTIQYANNKAKRVQHGAPTPSVTLTMLDIDYKQLMIMKGYVSDSKGGYVISSKGKPHVAMIICSSDYDDNPIYDCFANGEVIETGKDHKTNDSKEEDYNAALEYDVLDPIGDSVFLDDNNEQQLYKVFYGVETGFDASNMYKEVFGGYTAATSSSGQ
ncbi:phage tail protein [Lactobacillus amylolyticus]|uniref:phage tail protein n=1 Tax=Lactobacillus amylolyticus TaxID=83683 RepID=UPI00248FDC46|nr:phage tail protein [Lactobacillus amylolyticus]